MLRPALAASLGAALWLAAVPAMAQSSGFVGHWRWNAAVSKAAPGEPPPKAMDLQITSASAAQISWSITVTDQQGAHPDNFTGVADNQPHPIGPPEEKSTVTLSLTGATMKASYASADGQSEVRTCTLSPDQRQMTCAGTLSDGKGHSAAYTDLYDRV